MQVNANQYISVSFSNQMMHLWNITNGNLGDLVTLHIHIYIYIYIAKQKYDKDKGNPRMTQYNRNFMIIKCTG